MRFIVTADLHVKNRPPGRIKDYRRLFRDITELGKMYNCQAVICAGDTWDEKHGVNVEVLLMIHEELRRAKKKCPWILLRGNHCIPMKSEAEVTLLTLLKGVATIVNRPTAMHLPNGSHIAFMPWYLHDEFIPKAKTLTDHLKTKPGNSVMIAHIGLDEGQLSPSNYYRVPQRVALNHLYPDYYKLVMCGDYHMRQKVGKNALYLGTPIPQGFIDAPTQGVWLLDMEGTPTLKDLELLYDYPQFYVHKIGSYSDICSVDLSRDYHKICGKGEVIRDIHSRGLHLRENVTTEKIPEEKEVTASRLKSVDDSQDAEEIYEEFCQIKHWKNSAFTTGREYIKKAKELVNATASKA